MTPPYLQVEDLVDLVDEPARTPCRKILAEHRDRLESAPGSLHNHQAWRGGYLDHVAETMNVAVLLYAGLSAARPLPFSRSDALLVLFLHDLEKPWRFSVGPEGSISQEADLSREADKRAFREDRVREYGLQLTTAQQNALTYVEGEKSEYRGDARVMNELAAFCHICDVASARIWHDYPRAADDPWPGARRTSDRGSRIETEGRYEVAVLRIDHLWDSPVGSPEAQELDALATQVVAFQNQHHQLEPPGEAEFLAGANRAIRAAAARNAEAAISRVRLRIDAMREGEYLLPADELRRLGVSPEILQQGVSEALRAGLLRPEYRLAADLPETDNNWTPDLASLPKAAAGPGEKRIDRDLGSILVAFRRMGASSGSPDTTMQKPR